jgi:putative serine protease PepD
VGLVGGLALHGDDGSPSTATELPAAPGAPLAPTSVGRIYDRVSGGVASVRTNEGSGTGFVINANGTLVTNDHVVGSDKQVEVRFEDKGDLMPAKVVGTDPSSDLAVLRLESKPPTPLTVLPLADSDRVRVGDDAIAIGYPLGLARTATRGIVSGLGREIQAPNGFQIDKVIQTDAPINPGNSGGPLLDSLGRVIGVNSQIATSGAGTGNIGIGFAVPSNTVRATVPQLKAGQGVQHAYLGVSTAPPMSGSGAEIGDVNPGSPADRAGAQVGDIVVEVDGEQIHQPEDIATAIADNKPGDRVTVRVRRNGREQTLDVTLGNRPATAPSTTVP